jgi:ATP-dependent Clp protease ATP-binding subunit ClpC
MVPDGSDLAQLYAEAQDIARNVQQPETTAHDLLALFTFENRAQVLLKERGINEDTLLAKLDSVPVEPPEVRRQLPEKTRELAKRVGSAEADCLHLLICLTGLKESLAYSLLERCGVPVPQLRNTALSYFTGRMPRRLQNLKVPPPRATPPPISSGAALGSQPEHRPATAVMEAVQVEARPQPRERFHRTAAAASSDLELDQQDFPWLCDLGRNLSLLAEQQRIDPVIGRGHEIEQVIDILGKRRANNPLLVGEPGVGKTAVVEGVAQQLLRASTPGSPRRIVVELDVASIVAGTQLRGSFSEKLNGIKDEVRRAGGRVVVFIDEIHTLVGAGSTGEGPQDAANELKAALARGEFPCIGATTHDEFRKFIQNDPALERRFTALTVAEPNVPQTVEMLRGVLPHYESHHGVRFDDDALEAAVVLSTRYLVDRCLPDKALAVLDQAGSRAHRQGLTAVDATEIARTVARMAGLPETRLTLGERERLLGLEDELQKRVVGHRLAIERVATAVRRNSAGFHTRRPIGSFLFVGPTGVGKTELARALAEILYGTRDSLIQIDMSEMSEAHAVARLIGAPPGYVGYGEAGQLTEAVRRRPSSVVLLDEIEKAHHDVTMLLLQLLEEGRLSDSRGRHIDFSNTVVILTTNLGSEAFGRGAGPMGFGRSRDEDGASLERAIEAARRHLAPELWNRVDEKLGFPPLTRDQVERIAHLLLSESSDRLAAERRISYRVDEPVIAHLLDHGGYDRELGARPMRQTIARLIEGPVADRILRGELAAGETILVSLRGSRLEFTRNG